MSFAYLNEFIAANGTPPSDFTTSQINSTTGTIDIQSNQLRLLTSSTNFNTLRLVLPTSNWLDDDGALVLSYAPTTGLGQMNLILRGSGSWSALGDAPTNGYQCFLNMAGAYFEIYRHNAGVATKVGTTQSYTWSTGVGYFTRFYTLGAQLKVKIWLVTVNEPEAWTYEVTDGSPYTTAGQLQLTFRTVDSAVRDIRVGDIGIQTLPVAGVARSTGAANNASVTISGASTSVNAQVAVSVGAAEFDGDDSDSINLEIYAPVPGGGQAYNATVTTVNNTNVAAQSLVKTGVANNPSVTRTGAAEPAVITGAGAAHAATVTTSTGTVTASAQVASGVGDATGITFLLDENGEAILDELGNPIEDGAGLTIKVSLTSGTAASTGAGNAAAGSVAPHAGLAAAVSVAPNPAVTTVGDSTTTNVNPTTASSAGSVTAASTLISPTSGSGSGAGAAHAPQITIPVQAAIASSTGVAYDWDPASATPAAAAVGAAFDAQVNVDGNNFVAAAPIPINATAPDAFVGISVYPDAITAAGSAYPANQTADEPGQLVTVRDHGHTVSLKER